MTTKHLNFNLTALTASLEIGNSKVRCYKAYQPFSHVSVDPLGYVKIKIGRKIYKNFPFIVVDVNLGCIDMEILQSLEATEVYLALSRIEFKHGTKLIQVFSDLGTQLNAKLLGEKSSCYSKERSYFLKIFNNTAYSQFRNFCERKVQMAKKIFKNALQGNMKPQERCILL